MNPKNKLALFILVIIIFIGAIFRFYNLNWDGEFFFHPDETVIIFSSANLKPPFRPDIFDYGSFTIYLYRISAEILTRLTNNSIWLTAENINSVGRFFSASFSVITIYLIFYLGKLLHSKTTGLLAAFFTSVNVGLIQAAHFSTTETILTLTLVLIVISGIKILNQESYIKGYITSAIALGIACSTKLTGLVFLPNLFIAHLISLTRDNLFRRNVAFILSLVITILTFLIVNPYSIRDYQAFVQKFEYTSSVSTGRIPIFYTVEFEQTTPYIFQFSNIFPWTVGWPVIIFGVLGFLYISFQSFKNLSKDKFMLIFLPLVFFIYFGAIFAKWVRYILPISPIICLLAAYFLLSLYNTSKRLKILNRLTLLLIILVVLFQTFYALAFLNIYIRQNSRIEASEWIYQNVPTNSTLLLEPYDTVALPLPTKNYSPSIYTQRWFDFYSLDDSLDQNIKLGKVSELSNILSSTNYIVVGSRRIYANRLRLPEKYPITTKYYTLLFNGTLGFEKVAEITSYPNLFKIVLNDDSAEESFQVFDHPKIMVFKKVNSFIPEQYLTLLKI